MITTKRISITKIKNDFNTRDDFLKSLISQFVNRRKSLNMTQEDVDAKMGNADRLVSKWECGLRTPTSFNLYCWAETLKTSLTIKPIE